MTDVEKYHALVSLYNRMPTNGTRTVESKVNQQYSTPPPLAFVGACWRISSTARRSWSRRPGTGC